MSKYLVTLNHTSTRVYFGDTYKYDSFTPVNKIVEFKGELPTEDEIYNLEHQEKTEHAGTWQQKIYVYNYTILFMQKLEG